MKKKRGNIAGLGVLMLLALGLLVVFMTHWLVGQYEKEKVSLTRDLTLDLAAIESQVMDSAVKVLFLDPLLKDSSLEREEISINIDIDDESDNPNGIITQSITTSSNNGAKVEERIIKRTRRRANKFSTSWHNTADSFHKSMGILHQGLDSFHHKAFKLRDLPKIEAGEDVRFEFSDSFFQSDSNTTLIVNGVKSLLKEVAIFMDDEGQKIRTNVFEPDTSVLKRRFSTQVVAEYPGIKVDWTNQLSDDSPVTTRTIWVPTNVNQGRFGAQVGSYFWVIIGEIKHQVMVSVLLVLITAIAFGITFKGLVKQRKLHSLKNEFIGNMSHEMKTPVSTVKVALETLQSLDENTSKEKLKEYLGMAQLELLRLENLVTKAFNIALLDEGKMHLQKKEMVLQDVLNEVVQPYQHRFSTTENEIEVQQVVDTLPVLVDKEHVKGVLHNLIENAIKYGGSPAKIRMKLDAISHWAVVSVSDNGSGIPQEYRDKVFEKYFRIPTGNVHNIKGHGLGLHYAKQIVEEHGGTIQVTESEWGGSKFEVKIPIMDKV